jgi:hypothetical protein
VLTECSLSARLTGVPRGDTSWLEAIESHSGRLASPSLASDQPSDLYVGYVTKRVTGILPRVGGWVFRSILGNHIHLIIEADSAAALSAGMRGLTTRLALRLNAHKARKGRVFEGRYHSQSLSTSRQLRNALHYVLHNQSIHRLRGGESPLDNSDRFSTARAFDGIRDRYPKAHCELFGCSRPRTWLRRVGWRKYHPLLESRLEKPPAARCFRQHRG